MQGNSYEKPEEGVKKTTQPPHLPLSYRVSYGTCHLHRRLHHRRGAIAAPPHARAVQFTRYVSTESPPTLPKGNDEPSSAERTVGTSISQKVFCEWKRTSMGKKASVANKRLRSAVGGMRDVSDKAPADILLKVKQPLIISKIV